MTSRERIIAAFSNALDALSARDDAANDSWFTSTGAPHDSTWSDAFRILARVKAAVLDADEGFTDKALAEIVALAEQAGASDGQKVETGGGQ